MFTLTSPEGVELSSVRKQKMDGEHHARRPNLFYKGHSIREVTSLRAYKHWGVLFRAARRDFGRRKRRPLDKRCHAQNLLVTRPKRGIVQLTSRALPTLGFINIRISVNNFHFSSPRQTERYQTDKSTGKSIQLKVN